MILIADSGSSKTDWAYFDKSTNQFKIIRTIGLNPYFIDSKRITDELNSSFDLLKISKSVRKVFFYGAGCSDDSKKNIIFDSLNSFFLNSNIHIEHDLLGACYSVNSKKTSINCILGTGSIACIYNGKDIELSVPSLGFILGDEGSGNYFGKKILNLYLTNQLPRNLKSNFEKNFDISYEKIMNNVYQSERPNFFLSSFFPFLAKNQTDPFISNILKNGLLDFLNIHVFSIPNFRDYDINFFGSVSLILKEKIIEILRERKCKIGLFIDKPILGLCNYHYKK